MSVQKYDNKKVPLQAQTNQIKNIRAYCFASHFSENISKTRMKAAVSVEAAIVLPVVILLVVSLLQFFWLISANQRLEQAAVQTAVEAGRKQYAIVKGKNLLQDKTGVDKEKADQYFGGAKSVLDTAWFYKRMVGKLNFKDSGDAFGARYFHCLGSNTDIANNQLTLHASCQFRLMYLPKGLATFPLQKKIVAGMWLGKSLKDTNENNKEQTEYVYVTEHGTVYHNTTACSFLKLSIRDVAYSEVGNLRSNDGSKYYPCVLCKPEKAARVYITDDGTNYHSSTACSGLKRTIRKVEKSKVAGMRACSKCGGKH